MNNNKEVKDIFKRLLDDHFKQSVNKTINIIRKASVTKVYESINMVDVRLIDRSETLIGVKYTKGLSPVVGDTALIVTPDPTTPKDVFITSFIGVQTGSSGVSGVSTSSWLSYDTGVSLALATGISPVFMMSAYSTDLRPYIGVGTRHYFIQNGTTKYFKSVTGVSMSGDDSIFGVISTLDIGGSLYNILGASHEITDAYYSREYAPVGFPIQKTKWLLETTSNVGVSQGNPTQGTWYNLASLKIDLPIGTWDVYYAADADFAKNTATNVEQKATLSTANNTESDSEFTDQFFCQGATGAIYRAIKTLSRKKELDITTKTSYYLNALTNTAATVNYISWRGDLATTVVRATLLF